MPRSMKVFRARSRRRARIFVEDKPCPQSLSQRQSVVRSGSERTLPGVRKRQSGGFWRDNLAPSPEPFARIPPL